MLINRKVPGNPRWAAGPWRLTLAAATSSASSEAENSSSGTSEKFERFCRRVFGDPSSALPCRPARRRTLRSPRRLPAFLQEVLGVRDVRVVSREHETFRGDFSAGTRPKSLSPTGAGAYSWLASCRRGAKLAFGRAPNHATSELALGEVDQLVGAIAKTGARLRPRKRRTVRVF